MVLQLVGLQFTANTNQSRGKFGFAAPQALRQFLCCCLASFPVNVTVGGDWNIMMIVPVLESARTKEFLVEMRLVDAG